MFINPSLIGMHLFACKFCDKAGGDDYTDCDRKNFDTLLWALVTVFTYFFTLATLNGCD